MAKRTSTFYSVNRLYLGAIGVILVLGLLGCRNPIFRPQSPELFSKLKSEAKDVRYISDVCRIWGLNFAKVECVALANNLDGTGSDPANNPQRRIIIDEMKAHHVDDPDEILSSDRTSVILVQGFMPPGAKKGDQFDLRIGILPKSKTESLKGGFCMTAKMKPFAQLGNRTLGGHKVAIAEGPILTHSHFDNDDGYQNRVSGVILGGGTVTKERGLGLAIASEEASVRLSNQISNVINARFSIYSEKGKVGVAEPKSDRNILLKIPKEYKHNMGRFFRVVLNLAFEHPQTNRFDRLEKLEQQLNQPEMARTAALRLEGIGNDSTGALRRGLNHPDVRVRFYSAEALCYLGNDAGISQLEKIAKTESAFLWHALSALASLKETKAGTALTNLMHEEDVAIRYGAFRSMLARSPQDPMVVGKELGRDRFHLHVVPSTTRPALHISRMNRPEIVVFNETQSFADDFVFVKSGITARALDSENFEIKVYLPNGGDQVIRLKNRVAVVIERLARLGCDYGCMIEMLREASASRTIQSEVVINSAPKPQDQQKWQPDQLPKQDDASDVAGPMPELFRQPTEKTGSGYDDYADELDTHMLDPKLKDPDGGKGGGIFDRINPFKRNR